MELNRPGAGPVVRAVGFAALLITVACARPAPPPGGPPDTTPPEVIEVSPKAFSVGVPADTTVTVIFSEKIDPATFERALWVSPGGAGKPKISISGERVTVKMGKALPESSTVAVLLTTVIQDRRRGTQQNPLKKPYRWVFSTGDSIWPGVVEGRVKQVGNTSRGQVLVALYPGAADTVPDPLITEPWAVTQADSSGDFSITGLPVDGERRWLLALMDRDGNREIGGRGEFASAKAESLTLTRDQPRAEIALELIDPLAPGKIQGVLSRAEGDSVTVWVEAFEAEADSLARARSRIRSAADGAFSLPQIPPGSYRVTAFCDLDDDKQRGPDEEQQVFGLVEVEPGQTLELGIWDFPSCRR